MIRGATPVARARPLAVERVGKEPVEGLGAFFVEVVPAEPPGQAEAVGQSQGHLPEQGELLEVVVEI